MSLLMLSIYLLPEASSAACWRFPGLGGVADRLRGLLQTFCGYSAGGPSDLRSGSSQITEDVRIPPAIIPFDQTRSVTQTSTCSRPKPVP